MPQHAPIEGAVAPVSTRQLQRRVRRRYKGVSVPANPGASYKALVAGDGFHFLVVRFPTELCWLRLHLALGIYLPP